MWYILAESLTPDKKIIAMNHENKLSKIGDLARAQGKDIHCPGDHHSCTATIPCANAGDEKLGVVKLLTLWLADLYRYPWTIL